MNYKEWANQYFVQAEIIKKHIKNLKNKTIKEGTSNSTRVDYRISLLYKMYLELTHVAKYLRLCERRNLND